MSIDIKLRDYQRFATHALIKDVDRGRNALCVLPTGSGKSIVIVELIYRLLTRGQVVVVFNNVELFAQQYMMLGRRFPGQVTGYCGSLGLRDASGKIVCALIQSIHKREFKKLSGIIIDEVHNLNDEVGMYKEFLTAHFNVPLIGFTATPYRTGDGEIYGVGKYFPGISFERTMQEMIKDGYLVVPRLKRPEHQFELTGLRVKGGDYAAEDIEKLTGDDKKLHDQVMDALNRLSGRRKVVWFCSSIQHAERVVAELLKAGELAVSLHSGLQGSQRATNKDGFHEGNIRHMAFVSIVKEGYDYPPIDSVVFLRPTRSPVLYVQVAGRGLRPFGDKKDCLILDYGRVVETLGPLDSPAILRKRASKKYGAADLGMKFCPACFEYLKKTVIICMACGHDFTPPLPIKNTTREASEKGELLSKPEELEVKKKEKEKPKAKKITADVVDVYIRDHLSSSGRSCLRILYVTTDLKHRVISEYFAWDMGWSKINAKSRVEQLGVVWIDNLDELTTRKVTRIPSAVVFTLDKFAKVDHLVFSGKQETGKGNPERDPALSEQS